MNSPSIESLVRYIWRLAHLERFEIQSGEPLWAALERSPEDLAQAACLELVKIQHRKAKRNEPLSVTDAKWAYKEARSLYWHRVRARKRDGSASPDPLKMANTFTEQDLSEFRSHRQRWSAGMTPRDISICELRARGNSFEVVGELEGCSKAMAFKVWSQHT